MRRDPWFWRVKAAQRDLIERCGGVRRAAEIAECSPAWIGKCNTPNEDAFLSAVQKRRLEQDAGEPVVSRVECELMGFEVSVPGEAGGASAASQIASAHAAHARLVAEFGELLAGFADRVGDGEFSRSDGAATDRDLADIVARAEEFRRLIAAFAARGAQAPS